MRSTGIIFFILLLILSCDTQRSFSVPEENYFVKFYGEEGEQEGVDFVVNPDGTIVMVGNTERPGVLSQIYVVKVDANGHELWNKKFGLPDKSDKVKDIELHSDGRIVIVGETEMAVGNRDVYIKTISQDGLPLDSARAGLNSGSVDTDEEVNSVSIIKGGMFGGIAFPAGFMVTGSTTLVKDNSVVSDLHDAMALRFDNSLVKLPEIDPGKPIWTGSRYGFNGDDVAVKAYEFDPATIYFFGYSNRVVETAYLGDYNFWYYTLSANGGAGFSNYFGKASEDELLNSVEIVFDHAGVRFVLSGTAESSGGSVQSYVAGLPSPLSFTANDTDILKEKNPSVIATSFDKLLKVKVVGSGSDSYLSISNDTRVLNQGFSIALTKLNSDLIGVSEPLIFGGEGDDFAGSVAELPNGRILLMGTMTVGQSSTIGQKKMVLMKLNSEGKLAE